MATTHACPRPASAHWAHRRGWCVPGPMLVSMVTLTVAALSVSSSAATEAATAPVAVHDARAAEVQPPCNCSVACELWCAKDGAVCCSESRGAGRQGGAPKCACSNTTQTCDECAGGAPAHGGRETNLDLYDITLGFVFDNQPGVVVPIDFWTAGGSDRVKKRRTEEVVSRRDNYSVYGVCARNCQYFEPGPYWNGTRCDAWTVVVVDRETLDASFECTLFQFDNVDTGPAVPVDVVCSGCASGVAHKTWPEMPLYTVVFSLIVAGYVAYVIWVGWRWRHAGDVQEYVLMATETFLPQFFAVIEMSQTACSESRDFAPTLIAWMALAGFPKILQAKNRISASVASEELFEALQHGGHDDPASVGRLMSESRAAVYEDALDSDDDDDDEEEEEERLPLTPSNSASGVQGRDRAVTRLVKLERRHTRAQQAVDAFEPVSMYSDAANGYILLHLYSVVLKQPARSGSALLFLFFGLEHVIPVAVWLCVLVARKRDRVRAASGIVRFCRFAVSWLRAGSLWRAVANLATNRSVAMVVSVAYTTYFLRVVLRDYAATSGAHVTCPTLLGGLLEAPEASRKYSF